MPKSSIIKECSICGEFKYIFLTDKNKNFICRNCYEKLDKNNCSICNTYTITYIINNKNICNSCYNKTIKEKCFICNEIKHIYKRNENGDPICKKCGIKKENCSICGKLKIPSIRDENKNSICEECRNNNKTEKCIVCKKIKPTYKRNQNGESICKKCGRKKENCYICKELKIVSSRDKNGNPICNKCGRKKENCSICKKLKIVCSRNNNKPICDYCNEKIRLKNDENFLIGSRLRRYVRNVLNKYSKSGKIQESKKYGIDYEKIIEHLKPFPEDIEKYHIDHIIPLSVFDLNNPKHILAAFSPENHQWLKAKDNMSKNAKYNEEEFEKLIKKFE